LIVILFLGGWHCWGVTGSGNEITWMVAILRVIVMMAKVMAVILFFMLARWSWPRFRYDQLMEIGWKVMIPWGMVNLVVVATWIEFGSDFPDVGLAVVGWCVLALTWFVTSVADPTRSNNRPRREVQP
jgi:NADH-quinone oxidoreductase subunit H